MLQDWIMSQNSYWKKQGWVFIQLIANINESFPLLLYSFPILSMQQHNLLSIENKSLLYYSRWKSLSEWYSLYDNSREYFRVTIYVFSYLLTIDTHRITFGTAPKKFCHETFQVIIKIPKQFH